MSDTDTTETPTYIEVESDESDYAFDLWILDAWEGEEE